MGDARQCVGAVVEHPVAERSEIELAKAEQRAVTGTPVKDTCLAILAGRGTNEFLDEWSGRFTRKWMMRIAFSDHLASMRNHAFKWFRDECTEEWLIMVDDDMVPLPETEALLEAKGDIVGARAAARSGHESHQGSLSMGCVKVHRRVVEGIAPPWFEFAYTADGAEVASCECLYFWRKALDAGFTIVKSGVIGHRFPVTVVPGEQGPTFLLDDELRVRRRSTAVSP